MKDGQTERFAVSLVCGRIIRNLEGKNKLEIHCHSFDSLMTKTRTRHTASALIFFYYMCHTIRVNLGVKTCEVFLCFVAIVRVRVYYVYFFVCFMSQVSVTVSYTKD